MAGQWVADETWLGFGSAKTKNWSIDGRRYSVERSELYVFPLWLPVAILLVPPLV